MTETALIQIDDRPAIAAQPSIAADLSPPQQAEQRYLQAIETLVDDARANGYAEVLVEVLTWTLARIANAFGPPATADVLRRFGGHLGDLAQRARAQEEAKDAKKKGLRPH